MIEWVLDTLYPQFHHQELEYKKALLLFNTPEARITPVMEQLEAAYPDCRLYSLPSVGDNKMARHIELGVKARGGADKKEVVSQAFVELLKILETMQCKVELLV